MAKSKVVITRDSFGHPLCKCGGRWQEFIMLCGQVQEIEFDRDATAADLKKPHSFPGRTVPNPHYGGGEVERESFRCSNCGEEPEGEVFDLLSCLMPGNADDCPVPEDFAADVKRAGEHGALSGVVELVQAQAKLYSIDPEALCWFLREKIRKS